MLSLTNTLLLLLLLLLLLSQSSGNFLSQSSEGNDVDPRREPGHASEIRLKAGVIHAPPFAMVEHEEDGSTTYRGFQMDMIKRLKTFAMEDGVDLQIELSPAPSQYGQAFDLIANDCNMTEDNPNSLEKCEKFDLIVGDYYCNSERSMRAELSPSWLKTSMTTIKYIEKEEGSEDYTTLTDAEAAKATVCVPVGTYLSTVVMEKFPNTTYIECNAADGECISNLKSGNCVLFADDELLLHYQASQDPSLQVTRESFNSQYLVWAIRDDMSRPTLRLLKKWMYKAVQTATLDELYFKYFQRERCPHGTAGENCELPCDPDHGTADAQGGCVCTSTKWTGDDCSIEVMEELNLLPQGIVLSCYGMAGVNFVLVAGCAMWLWLKRNKAQVKMAQPLFLVLILVGCVISTSTIFALGQEDEGDGPVHACAVIPWLYSIGFSLTFGTMFARIRRVHIIMQSAIKMKRVTISTRETLLSVALVLAVDVVILFVWTFTDPLQWSRRTTSTDLFGEPLESEGYCDSDHWRIFAGIIAVFHLSLLIMACFMCYLARTIPDRISHCKWIAIAMFSNLQIFIVSIPLMVIVGSDPTIGFFIRSAAIWINDFAVIFFVFGSLMYKVYRSDNKLREAKMSSHMSLTNDIQEFAKKVRESGHNSTSEIAAFSITPADAADEKLRSFHSEPSGLSCESLVDVENKQSESSSCADTGLSPNQNLVMASPPIMMQDLSKGSEGDRRSNSTVEDNLGHSSRDDTPTTRETDLEDGSNQPTEFADSSDFLDELAEDNRKAQTLETTARITLPQQDEAQHHSSTAVLHNE